LAGIEAWWEIGELMDHDVRTRSCYCASQQCGIEDIEDDGFDAGGLQHVGFAGRAGCADDVMPGAQQ
jgi:hypothetical protein